ncbi:MAG: hypothetical protein GY786_15325 [Proteobacteria bacterium]|nr:hypothetical protein [Pseudomonadota bacterium]
MRFGTPEGEKEVTLNVIGPHVGEVLSGLIAICYELGLVWKEIKERLTNLPQEKGRSRFLTGIDESTLLDDTYNANPESVINMLQTICSLDKEVYIGVVGNLAEMDEGLQDSAQLIVDRIPVNLTHLFLGGETGKILLPIIQNNHPQLKLYYIDDLERCFSILTSMTTKNTVIGIKGSRTSHMERLIMLLCGKSCNCYLPSCTKLMNCSNCDQL